MASKKNKNQKVNVTVTATKKRGFPYKYFLAGICLLASVITYDVKQQDSFIRSQLKEYHVCEYTHMAVDKINDGLQWSKSKVEEQFPGLEQRIILISEPYVNLSVNLSKLGRNFFCNLKNNLLESSPFLRQAIDKDIPEYVSYTKDVLHSASLTAISYLSKSCEYLKNEVFVGSLSPENMQKTLVDVLIYTRDKTVEIYNSLYKELSSIFN
ncbi:unnamed protein product [Phyllotreta striolata]|uniref:Transmembrane protein n=1 Tax=Phyllotreta striolata TaxID=444603 RepID=A0A9N9TTN7_PHYSR|nr:unnamed protein product [Phyllotreta striolata]